MTSYTHYSDLSVNGKVSSSKQGEMIGSVTSMPTASAANLGLTVLYTGETSGGYVKNTMYTCTQNGSAYSWTTAISPAPDVSGYVPDTRKVAGHALSSDVTISASDVGAISTSYGPKTSLDGTKDTEIPTSKAVATAISSAVTGAYKVKGSKTVAQIGTLTSKVQGDVYNVSDAGTITGGPAVLAGDNVVWNGTEWDKLAATVDLSNYATKDTVPSAYQSKLTFDSAPTASSTNPVTSGGVKTALDGKLDKVTTSSDYWRLYAIGTNGSQMMLKFNTTPTYDDVPIYGSNGVLPVGTPTANNHAATKKYVDDAIAGKQDALVSGTNIKTVNGASILGSGNLAIESGVETWVIDDLGSYAPTFTRGGVTKSVIQFGEYVYANYTNKTICVTYSNYNDPDDTDALIFFLDYVRMREEDGAPAYQVRFIQSVGTFPIYYMTLTMSSYTLGMINLQTELTFDQTPTANSTNPVTSGGIKAAIDEATASSGGSHTIVDNGDHSTIMWGGDSNGLRLVEQDGYTSLVSTVENPSSFTVEEEEGGYSEVGWSSANITVADQGAYSTISFRGIL